MDEFPSPCRSTTDCSAVICTAFLLRCCCCSADPNAEKKEIFQSKDSRAKLDTFHLTIPCTALSARYIHIAAVPTPKLRRRRSSRARTSDCLAFICAAYCAALSARYTAAVPTPTLRRRRSSRARTAAQSWTGSTNASCAPAALQAAPATGGTRTSTSALQCCCRHTGV
jgi:hypothetical protein